jgi:hypothetical protein
MMIHQRKYMGNWVKGGRPYEEQRGKGGNYGFPYSIYYNRLFFMWMCVCERELNEISIKGMRKLLVPQGPVFG